MLVTENLSKSFGSLVAVDNVSLSVPAGSLHAVIGPNGAGKSTFFNLISGFFPPSRPHRLRWAGCLASLGDGPRCRGHGAHLPDHRDLPSSAWQ